MRRFGLIGYPLSHSFSARFFNSKFEQENIRDARFDLFPIENLSLMHALLEQYPALQGLAVTIPFKQKIIPFLDEVDYLAEQVGAVNCITIRNGITKGYNTDIFGFENSIQPLLKQHHTKALVLGTGGAAQAVRFVFEKLGIELLKVSRHPENNPNSIRYVDVTAQILQEYTVVVNCTPLGMEPLVNEFPMIPYSACNNNHLFYDLIYNPSKTLFLQKASEIGAVVKNGQEMLELQALENWRIWNL